MLFDSKKIKNVHKTSEGGTVSMPLGVFLDAVENERVVLPPEQREMTSKGQQYKKLSEDFVAYLLTQVFLEADTSADFEDAMNKSFGAENITIEKGSIQLVGVSVDAQKNVYMSDGNHRFGYYLQDFFRGEVVLTQGTDYGNDNLNEKMDILFSAVRRTDKDSKNAPKYISAKTMNKDDLDAIKNVRVIARYIKSANEKERASLFGVMNKGVPIRQADHDKCNYGALPAYQAINEAFTKLDRVKYGKPVAFDNGQYYDAVDTNILKRLFNNPMRTLVPMVAHACLLVYLPRKLVVNHPWEDNQMQSQAEQVRNFFKATEKMSREEFDKYLFKMMDDIVYLGKTLYENNDNKMSSAKGLKSLIVGQLYSLRVRKEEKIQKSVYEAIAKNITKKVTNNGYTPCNSFRTYNRLDFNNAHRLREKNELFATWVLMDYEAKQRKEAA